MFLARDDSRDRSRVSQLYVVTLHRSLRRHLDHHGTRAACAHLSECFGYGARDCLGRKHLSPPLGHRAHQVHLVQDFMNAAYAHADLGTRNLAGDEEHWRRAGIRGGQAGCGVVDAGARHHQGYPRFS